LSQTHGSETVGLAATLATLKECEKVKINDHTWGLGNEMRAGFNRLVKENNVENYIRMIGFDCNPQILCTDENGIYWPELHTSFHEELISWGVLIPWISICLTHGKEELSRTLEALDYGMKKVANIMRSGNVSGSFSGEAVKPVFREFN
jgi:glutamate-1-semialdehyde 2,1-aminomutase